MRKRKNRIETTADNDRRLIEAARAVFVERGYHATTLDRIAAAAGLTKGAVYARFDSKATLMLALIEQRITERVAEIRALPAPGGAEAVDRMFRQWLHRVRDDEAWALLVVEFRVAAARDRALGARFAAVHRRLVEAVAERVERGAAAAGVQLALPPLELAQLGIAYANGVLLEQEASGGRLSMAAAVRGNRAMYDGLALPAGKAARRGAA